MPKDYQAGPNRLPDLGMSDEEILAWRDKFFNKDSSYRTRHMERMTTAIHYVLGNHDITFSSTGIHETSNAYTFRKRSLDRGSSDFPNPVTNYIEVAVSTEMAALGKRKLVPKVVPRSTDPKVEAAAKTATEILEHKLKKLDWADKRQLATYFFVTCGLVSLKTYWDKIYSDTKKIGNPKAASCPDCGAKLSTPFISSEQRSGLNIPELGAVQQPEGSDEEGNPHIFLERIYSTNAHHAIQKAIIAFAQLKATAIGGKVFSREINATNGSSPPSSAGCSLCD